MDEPVGAPEAALQRVLLTVRPYLPNLTLIGGWVPYLYQKVGGFDGWSSRLSFTQELDVLLPEDLSVEGLPPLPELMREAGLRPINDGGATWTTGGASADEIEFLVPRLRSRGDQSTIPIRGQPGLSAIILPYLELLERFSRPLRVPITVADPPHPGITALDVRVPWLGAYVLNKAITSRLRQPRTGESTNPKAAKDLLYLRDLAAAGQAVAGAIEEDVARMIDADPTMQHAIDIAVSRLEPFARGNGNVDEVAAMLQEREPSRSLDNARADVLGHLVDLFEILEVFRSPPPEPPDDEDA
ncbi:MAG: hypothetical protein KGL93_11215 [Gemmatimonadota bacterium]|nr:hypothetical protein [Gemmatimonadota bacterium]